MNSAEVLIKFKGDTSDVDNDVKSLNSSMGKLTKSITLGNLAAKGISKGFQIMNANLDGAIKRVDTMNNFPKVMKNLGISTKDSSKVIKDLSEKLKGLPTTLDDAASAVQRLTTSTGDVKEAEDLFLSFNNAVLAGGASAQIQSSALEQFSQAVAKGKPDMMEWRTMLMAMPAQLNQVAKEMNYKDVASLGEAIRADGGEAEFKKMLEAIKKLNKEGTGEFASFTEQAKGSIGGINTSITNMKTAFVRGVGNMITKIDESLKSFGGLSGVITTIGQNGEKIFQKIGDVLSAVLPKLIDFGKWIQKNKTWISALVVVLGSMYAAFKLLTIINTIKTAVIGFQLAIKMMQIAALTCGTSMSTLTAALNVLNLSFLASPVFWIIAGIIALVAAFVILWNKCEWFRNFWIGLWNGIVSVVKGTIDIIVSIFNGIVDFVKNNWQGLLLLLVNPFAGAFKLLYDNCGAFRNFVNNFVNAVVGFFKSIPGKIKSFATGIVDVFKSIPGKLLDIGKNIVKGLWNGIKDMKNWVLDKVKGFGKSILNGLKGILGIHSPSTEFALIGKFSVLGYTEALDKMKNDVDKTVQSTFGLNPELTNSMQNTINPNIQVYNNVNIEQDPLGQMVRTIKTYSGGSPNDYNYGAGV